MSKAHNESADKSSRLRSVWAEKKQRARAERGVVTREAPRWLKPLEDKSGFTTIDERVQSIVKVFELTTSGYGSVAIARRANLEHWPVPGKASTWHTSLIGKLLANRAVLGEYQPFKTTSDGKRVPDGEPILDYYPRVVDDALFIKANACKRLCAKLPRRRDTERRNIFQGLLYCAQCGASFVRKNKSSKSKPSYSLYCCANRVRAVTGCKSLHSQRLEAHLISALVQRNFGLFARAEAASRLRDDLDVVSGSIGATSQRIRALSEAIATSPQVIPSLVSLLQDAESNMSSLKAKQITIQEELEALYSVTDEIAQTEAVAEILELIANPMNTDYRAALHAKLSAAIERIVIDSETSWARIFWRGTGECVLAPLSEQADLSIFNGASVPHACHTAGV